MSNPAVTKLRKLNFNKTEIWLDDNIGESIHFHLNDIRLDFTINEFNVLCDELSDAINELVVVPGFDFHKIDPTYFEFMLWENITHLKEVKYTKEKLSNLLVPANDGTLIKLSNSRLVKALNGDSSENQARRHSDLIGQSGEQRLNDVFGSISKYGYPLNDQYIILYNDDMIIQDGQHRAASLYTKYGDIEVTVQRFVFDNYVTRTAKIPFEYTLLGQLVAPFKHPMAYLRKKKKALSTSYSNFVRTNNMKKYMSKHNDDYLESLKIIELK